jgi:hypothetical protein
MHLKTLGSREHNESGRWAVLFHREFGAEFGAWAEEVQDALLSQLIKLREFGPTLGRPTVDALKGSAYPNMKELRFGAADGIWRVAFAFDRNRRAVLLVGGDKSGVSKAVFYSALIRKADSRFGEHLRSLERMK